MFLMNLEVRTKETMATQMLLHTLMADAPTSDLKIPAIGSPGYSVQLRTPKLHGVHLCSRIEIQVDFMLTDTRICNFRFEIQKNNHNPGKPILFPILKTGAGIRIITTNSSKLYQ